MDNFDLRNNQEALEYLKKAVSADKNFIEAYMMMAQIYREQGKHDQAIQTYRKALNIDPSFNPAGFLILADYLFRQGRYPEARDEVKKFQNTTNSSEQNAGLADSLLSLYEYAIRLTENPVPFEPVNLGDSVNSPLDEYWPSLSVDEEKLVFTVALPSDNKHPDPRFNFQEDFYFSEKKSDGTWTKRKNIGPPVNTHQNEGAQSITADGDKLYYTHCRAEVDRGNCNIYFSAEQNGKWSVPTPVGKPVNTVYREKQPSVSADDRILFFSSDRPGGMGGLDIWISYRDEKGNWSDPVNAGKNINTAADEQSPFIHPDGRTLYFSSDGRRGLGGSDIYFSVRNDKGEWTEARNIGYPVNTNKTEFSMIVNSAGNRAYFASNREEGKGTDIYYFDLYEAARPVAVSYMKGRVYDAETFIGLPAKFQLIDLASGELVIELEAGKGEGRYLVPLPTNRDYALNVSYPGYLFYSENFSFRGIHEKTNPFLKDVPMKPVKKGEKIVLRNIFFKFDKWDLKQESLIELEKLASFLENNPRLRVEISGHTDNIGSDEYNKLLSLRRAEAVVLYLVNHGIDPGRLESKGYGATDPIATNDTEQGRAMNRRTEMKILQ